MEYIIRPRGGGKTTLIIKEVEENDGYLLVMNETEKRRLIREYPYLKDKIFSWKVLEHLRGKEKKSIYIDNADYFLQRNNWRLSNKRN